MRVGISKSCGADHRTLGLDQLHQFSDGPYVVDFSGLKFNVEPVFHFDDQDNVAHRIPGWYVIEAGRRRDVEERIPEHQARAVTDLGKDRGTIECSSDLHRATLDATQRCSWVNGQRFRRSSKVD